MTPMRLVDPRVPHGHRAEQQPVDQAITQDVMHGVAGLVERQVQHEPEIASCGGAADGMRHRRAVWVDAQFGAGDDQADDRRASAGQVACGTVGAKAQTIGALQDARPDVGPHTWPAVQRAARCGA
jgi:hypothetical protein